MNPEDSAGSATLPTQRVAEIELVEGAQRWLVQSLWSDQAVGFIGGSPKSCLCRARHRQDHAAPRIMPRAAGITEGLWDAHWAGAA